MREIYRYDREAGAVVRKPESEPQQFIEMLPCPGGARGFRDLQELMQISLVELCSNMLAGRPAESMVSGVVPLPRGMNLREYYDALHARYAECVNRQVSALLVKEPQS